MRGGRRGPEAVGIGLREFLLLYSVHGRDVWLDSVRVFPPDGIVSDLEVETI